MYKIVYKMNKSLFGYGKEKILKCFYRNRSKEIYFSEILRETKLTQNTTLKHLKNLQEQNLIKCTKKIGNTFYKINSKNAEIFSIFSYFDYKRFNELPFERRNAISEFMNQIQIKPLIAIVFGSTAKGTFEKTSDIDLLLIYNKKESKDLKLNKDIKAITGIEIQTFIISLEYFKEQLLKEEDKVVVHAIKTGFVISGHDQFYKKVLN